MYVYMHVVYVCLYGGMHIFKFSIVIDILVSVIVIIAYNNWTEVIWYYRVRDVTTFLSSIYHAV